MKRLLCFLLFVPVLMPAQTAHKKITVLFLGNSFTYVNNLPLLISNMALANGDTMVYDGNTIGGYSLYNHFNDAVSLSKINAQPWHYVILQAQSQEPSFPPQQVNTQTLPYAIKLDSAVKHNNSCSSLVFYETWGKKNGDASNCAGYPIVCTYTGMQNRLKQSYKLFADTTHRIMSPVGEAFRKSIAADPALELYDPDQTHPSLAGSYLAAAVFYEVLFQKSVLTNTYTAGITAGTAAFLRQTAHATVNDSLALWNIGRYAPWADFDASQLIPPACQFQSLSAGLNNTWYFGDGATSLSANPFYNYTAAGTYTVSHVVKNTCKKDSVSKTIGVTSTGLQAYADQSAQLSLYPDPCHNKLYIKNAGRFTSNGSVVEIRNTVGSLVQQSVFSDVVTTDQLENGIYFITIYNGAKIWNARFIKSE